MLGQQSLKGRFDLLEAKKTVRDTLKLEYKEHEEEECNVRTRTTRHCTALQEKLDDCFSNA